MTQVIRYIGSHAGRVLMAPTHLCPHDELVHGLHPLASCVLLDDGSQLAMLTAHGLIVKLLALVGTIGVEIVRRPILKAVCTTACQVQRSGLICNLHAQAQLANTCRHEMHWPPQLIASALHADIPVVL